MPKTAPFVQPQSGNCSLQKPEQADTVAYQRHMGALCSKHYGLREMGSYSIMWAKRWPFQDGTGTPSVPFPVRTLATFISPFCCLYKTRNTVFSSCDGQVSEAGRTPVSRQGRLGKQDSQIMLAQLGTQPPGYVMNCTSTPGRPDRHLEDYIQTLKCTPTKQPSQTSNLAL